jgi:acyl-CoA reductase-like NAD-dependent aldehyde dehydrogenase
MRDVRLCQGPPGKGYQGYKDRIRLPLCWGAVMTTSGGAIRGSIPVPEQRAKTSAGHEGIDAAVTAVAAGAGPWAATAPGDRARLCDRMIGDTLAAADGWVADAVAAKRLAGNPAGEAEEWAAVWLIVRNLRALRDALGDIAAAGRPRLPGQPAPGPHGQLRVPVYPRSGYDRVTFAGGRAWVVLQPHVSGQDLVERQAWAYRAPAARAPVTAVLGAGNQAGLGPHDVLYQLFVKDRVAVLKASPVNGYLVPHWQRAFAALIERGALRIVTGGPTDGAYLVNHPQVDEVHLTGSDKTFEAVVFGPGPDGAARKAAGTPVLGKPVTGELGNLSPVIVVPGRWRRGEIGYQARHLATMLVNNAGFNCLTPRVLITAAAWPQRQALLDELARVLGQMPRRPAYYPGAADRHATFTAAHPGAQLLGRPGPDGSLPWTIVPGVDPGQRDDICFTTEAFCSLMAETALPAADPAQFLDQAARFANDTLWGTLAATVLIDPRTRRDPGVARALAQAVTQLRYGTVAVNVLAAGIPTATWGGYPGNPDTDIQSGRGVIGNTLMLPDPEKTIISAPFRTRPTPVWFATHPGMLPAFKALPSFEAAPTIPKLAGLMRSALRHR